MNCTLMAFCWSTKLYFIKKYIKMFTIAPTAKKRKCWVWVCDNTYKIKFSTTYTTYWLWVKNKYCGMAMSGTYCKLNTQVKYLETKRDKKKWTTQNWPDDIKRQDRIPWSAGGQAYVQQWTDTGWRRRQDLRISFNAFCLIPIIRKLCGKS